MATLNELLTEIQNECLWYRNHTVESVIEGVQPSGKTVSLISVPVMCQRLDGSTKEHKQLINVFDLGGAAEDATIDGHRFKNEAAPVPSAMIVHEAMEAAVAAHATATHWAATNRQTQLMGQTVNFFALVADDESVVAYWAGGLFKQFESPENPTGLMTSLVPVAALA